MIHQAAAALVIGLCTGLAWAQIELNKASEIDLDGIKGIGPALTRQVLAERQKAPFQDWTDVRSRVKGLGPVKAAQLSEQGLRVNGEPYTAPPNIKTAP